MTKDEIIRMAWEAAQGEPPSLRLCNDLTLKAWTPWLERFAATVAAREREACAKLAYELRFKACFTAEAIAAAIRARNVDPVDTSPECVEKTAESVREAPKLHRAGSFSD